MEATKNIRITYGNKKDGQSFVLFDVFIDTWWLMRPSVENIAEKLSIAIVPAMGIGTLGDMIKRVKEKPLSAWGSFPMEGLVARPVCELQARNGLRIITKLKVKDFG